MDKANRVLFENLGKNAQEFYNKHLADMPSVPHMVNDPNLIAKAKENISAMSSQTEFPEANAWFNNDREAWRPVSRDPDMGKFKRVPRKVPRRSLNYEYKQKVALSERLAGVKATPNPVDGMNKLVGKWLNPQSEALKETKAGQNATQRGPWRKFKDWRSNKKLPQTNMDHIYKSPRSMYGQMKMAFGPKTQNKAFLAFKDAGKAQGNDILQYLRNNQSASEASKLATAQFIESNNFDKFYGARSGTKDTVYATRKPPVQYNNKLVSLNERRKILERHSLRSMKIRETLEGLEPLKGGKKAYFLAQARNDAYQQAIKAYGKSGGSAKAYKNLRRASRKMKSLFVQEGKKSLLFGSASNKYARRELNKLVGKSASAFAAKSAIILMGISLAAKTANVVVKGAFDLGVKVTKFMDGLKTMEFGNGRALTTQMASTERQRSVEIIRNNKYGARRYLGQEARLMGT